MPMLHVCNHRGCHRIIPKNQKYCNEHMKQHNDWMDRTGRSKRIADRIYNKTRRNQEANRFYHSTQWTNTRNFIKRRDAMIDGVTGKMLSNHDYIVDHIVPRRLCHGIDKLNPNNLWLLSRHEHKLKTMIEDKMTDAQLLMMTRNDWKQKLLSELKR